MYYTFLCNSVTSPSLASRHLVSSFFRGTLCIRRFLPCGNWSRAVWWRVTDVSLKHAGSILSADWRWMHRVLPKRRYVSTAWHVRKPYTVVTKGVQLLYCKGPHPLLWGGSRAARVKTTINVIPNRLKHCIIFVAHICIYIYTHTHTHTHTHT
jgi:hypothetical protein